MDDPRDKVATLDFESLYQQCEELARKPDASRLGFLASALGIPDDRLRALAADAIGNLRRGNADVEADLVALAITSTEPAVASACVYALGQMGSAQAIPTVEGLLSGVPAPVVQRAAKVALRFLGQRYPTPQTSGGHEDDLV